MGASFGGFNGFFFFFFFLLLFFTLAFTLFLFLPAVLTSRRDLRCSVLLFLFLSPEFSLAYLFLLLSPLRELGLRGGRCLAFLVRSCFRMTMRN